MSSFPAILDANVLIPMTLRDTLLRAAEAKLYRPHWTDMILDEVERNLTKAGVKSTEKAQKVRALVSAVFPEAMVTEDYKSLIEVMKNEIEDRHVLAAAVVSKSQVIVTSNLKHFPQKILDKYNVEAQSPDHFLTNLLDLYQTRMKQILVSQAADCQNPQRSVLEVLERLEIQAPEFVERVRPDLSIDSNVLGWRASQVARISGKWLQRKHTG